MKFYKTKEELQRQPKITKTLKHKLKSVSIKVMSSGSFHGKINKFLLGMTGEIGGHYGEKIYYILYEIMDDGSYALRKIPLHGIGDPQIRIVEKKIKPEESYLERIWEEFVNVDEVEERFWGYKIVVPENTIIHQIDLNNIK